MPKFVREEKIYQRDPNSHLILGAETLEQGGGEKGVLFLHDWTSTPREFKELVPALAKEAFLCRAPLFKGHGLTPRALKGVRWNDLVDQVYSEFSLMKNRTETQFLLGQGFGAIIALHVCLRFQIEKLVLISPLLHPAGQVLGLGGSRWLSRKMPEFIKNLGVDTATPLFDSEALAEHICYEECPSEEFLDLLNAGQEILPKLNKIQSPTQIYHNPQNPIAAFSGALHLMKNLGGKHRELHIFGEGAHLLTLDKNKELVLGKILNFFRDN